MTRRTVVLLAVLCWSLFIFASVKLAHGQTITQATAPTDWMFIIVLSVFVMLIVVAIWYNKTHPGAVASVEADVSTIWHALEARIAALEGKITPVTPSIPPSPPIPAGKNGIAGVLTIAVTGDPKVDLPAFNTQYFS